MIPRPEEESKEDLGIPFLLSPEELEELEEWVRKQDEDGGQNGESAVWGPGRKKDNEEKDGVAYLDSLD